MSKIRVGACMRGMCMCESEWMRAAVFHAPRFCLCFMGKKIWFQVTQKEKKVNRMRKRRERGREDKEGEERGKEEGGERKGWGGERRERLHEGGRARKKGGRKRREEKEGGKGGPSHIIIILLHVSVTCVSVMRTSNRTLRKEQYPIIHTHTYCTVPT